MLLLVLVDEVLRDAPLRMFVFEGRVVLIGHVHEDLRDLDQHFGARAPKDEARAEVTAVVLPKEELLEIGAVIDEGLGSGDQTAHFLIFVHHLHHLHWR